MKNNQKTVIKKAAQIARAVKGSDAVKVLSGAAVGVTLGSIAALLLTPESGKKLRKDIGAKSAEFYKTLAPKIKKMKRVGEKEYKAAVNDVMKTYGKAKRLSDKEAKHLIAEAHKTWKHVVKKYIPVKKTVPVKKPVLAKKRAK